MEDEKFEKEFNSKITEHVRFIEGFLEALCWVTLRNDYKHMFWIRTLNWTENDRFELLSKKLDLKIRNIIKLDNYVGELESKIKELSYKYFLGGDYDKNSENTLGTIENLVWHVVEYIEWLKEFSYSCEVEKAELDLDAGNSGELFCFAINQKYIVILGITEILIEKETEHSDQG